MSGQVEKWADEINSSNKNFKRSSSSQAEIASARERVESAARMSEARRAAAAQLAGEPSAGDPNQVVGESEGDDSDCNGFGSDVSD